MLVGPIGIQAFSNKDILQWKVFEERSNGQEKYKKKRYFLLNQERSPRASAGSKKSRKGEAAKGVGRKSFSVAPLTQEDKSAIGRFMADFTNKNAEQLLELSKDSKEEISRLNRIHPLILVSFIVSEPELYQYVETILQIDEKSNIFIFILSMRIEEAKAEGSIHQYISDFADLLHLDQDVIRSYIGQEKYKELIRYIFQL